MTLRTRKLDVIGTIGVIFMAGNVLFIAKLGSLNAQSAIKR